MQLIHTFSDQTGFSDKNIDFRDRWRGRESDKRMQRPKFFITKNAPCVCLLENSTRKKKTRARCQSRNKPIVIKKWEKSEKKSRGTDLRREEKSTRHSGGDKRNRFKCSQVNEREKIELRREKMMQLKLVW